MTTTTPTTTTTFEQHVTTGNLLARNHVGHPYELIQLTVDGVIRFDAQRSIRPSVNFSFEDGLQTTADPLVVQISGRELVHSSDQLVFLDDYVANNYPPVKAVLSDSFQEGGTDETIEWSGPARTWPGDSNSGYDPELGLIYEVVPNGLLSTDGVWLIAIDAESRVENYRVRLAEAEFYSHAATGAEFGVFPLAGSERVVISTNGGDGFGTALMLHDSVSGALKAIASEPTGIKWGEVVPYRSSFLMLGVIGSGAIYRAVIDPVNGTIEIDSFSNGYGGASLYITAGRVTASFSSWLVHVPGNVNLYEVAWDGADLENYLVGSFTLPVHGAAYDEDNNAIVISLSDGSTNEIISVDGDTRDVNFTITLDHPIYHYGSISGRMYPSAGYVLFYNGTNVYSVSIVGQTVTPWATVFDTAGHGWTIAVQDLGSYFVVPANAEWHAVNVALLTPQYIGLESVITRITALAGWAAGDLIFNDGMASLEVPGFVLDRDTNTQDPLSLLSQIFDFSYADIGAGLYFQKTSRDDDFVSDATIDADDMALAGGISLSVADEPDNTMPSMLTLDYISVESGYQRRQVDSIIPNGLFDVTDSVRQATITASVVLFDDDAVELVHQRHYSMLEYERTYAFSLPIKYLRLVPGNVVEIPRAGNDTLILELTKVDVGTNNRIDFEARDFQTSVATSVATESANPNLTAIALGATASRYIDIDTGLIREADDLGGAGHRRYGVLASRGQGSWTGASKYEGPLPQQLTQTVIQANTPTSIVGAAIEVLAAPDNFFVTDPDSVLVVVLTSGSASDLSSCTHEELMLGANRFMLGQPGRWEIGAFETVVDNGDGTVSLSGLIRGDKGTEVNCANHQVGDVFYLINSLTMHRQVYGHDLFQDTRYFKAVGIGAVVTTGTPEAHEIEGNAEKPYAPVNIAGVVIGDDLDLSWDWRSRIDQNEILLGDDSTIIGETSLGFEVDIHGGSDIARTLSTVTNAVTYSAAEIAVDFGTMPATLTVDVYMISALVGRGYPGTATITL